MKHLHFTIDCDWVPGSEKGLEALLDCCDRYGMTATVFFTGRFAEAYPNLVRDCHERGHQLGTHGWAHGGLEEDEDFRTAGYEQQRTWIRQATQAVEQAAGVRPVIFRAPNLGSVKPPCGSLKKKAISTIPRSRPGALTWGSDVFII